MQPLQDQYVSYDTVIEMLANDLRHFLRLNTDRWPEMALAVPGLSYSSLTGFAYANPQTWNPKLSTLIKMERACRIVDPDYPAPLAIQEYPAYDEGIEDDNETDPDPVYDDIY